MNNERNEHKFYWNARMNFDFTIGQKMAYFIMQIIAFFIHFPLCQNESRMKFIFKTIHSDFCMLLKSPIVQGKFLNGFNLIQLLRRNHIFVWIKLTFNCISKKYEYFIV